MEFREIHVEGAQLSPLVELDPAAIARQHGNAPACVVICRSGKRSCNAAEKLTAAGMKNLHILDGGMLAWAEAGLPANRGKKSISLERQVRIAAGILIVAGTILTATISRWFLVIPGFVGAGLTFAGMSNTCGMGLILARMPWNKSLKVKDCSGGGCCSP